MSAGEDSSLDEDAGVNVVVGEQGHDVTAPPSRAKPLLSDGIGRAASDETRLTTEGSGRGNHCLFERLINPAVNGDAERVEMVRDQGAERSGDGVGRNGTVVLLDLMACAIDGNGANRIIADVDAENHAEILSSPGQSTCRCSLRPARGSDDRSESSGIRKTSRSRRVSKSA